MNAAFYLHCWENVDLWNLAVLFPLSPCLLSFFFLFYDNTILQSVFLSSIKTNLSVWGQQKEGTPLQSVCILMEWMELWKTLEPMITCKITSVSPQTSCIKFECHKMQHTCFGKNDGRKQLAAVISAVR